MNKTSTLIIAFLIWTQWLIHILNLYSIHKQPYILWAVWSVKAKMTSADSVFSLHRHAMPCHRWRCLFWLSSSESKSPRGTKPEAYPLCMGNKGESTLWVQWRGRANWTLTGLLCSREITQIYTKKLHWNIEESSVLWFTISICSTWWNGNFHYLIDSIISQRGRYCRTFFQWLWDYVGDKDDLPCSLIMLHYQIFMKQFSKSKY